MVPNSHKKCIGDLSYHYTVQKKKSKGKNLLQCTDMFTTMLDVLFLISTLSITVFFPLICIQDCVTNVNGFSFYLVAYTAKNVDKEITSTFN